MAHDPKVLQTVCLAAAPPDLDLTFKPMFGGIMGYADGKVFASFSDMGVALKLSGEDREALLAVPGSKPLQYSPDQPPSRSYVVAPDGMLSDPDVLRTWIIRSVAGLAGKTAKARKRS